MSGIPSPVLSLRSVGGGSSRVSYSPLGSPVVGRRGLLPPLLAGRLLPHKKRVFPIDSEQSSRPVSPAGSDGSSGREEQPRSCLRDKRIRELFRASEIRCHSAPSSPRVSCCSQPQQQRQQQQQQQRCSSGVPAQLPVAGVARQRNASMCSSVLCHQQRQRHQRQQQQQQQLQPPPPPYPGSCHSLVAPGGFSAGTAAVVGSQQSLLSCRSVASTGGSYACHVQEVRDISLGRHCREPFGMKVERVGLAFFITHVVNESAAAYAGLKTGDEIVGINGSRLDGMQTKEVLQLIRQCEVSVRLSYRPRAVVARIREVRLMKDNGVVGLRLQKKSDGLYIEFVKSGTPAQEAGLKEGDQVLKVNGHFVTEWSMEGAMALLKSLNEQLVLLVRETLPLAQVSTQQPGQPVGQLTVRSVAAGSVRCPSGDLRSSRSTLASAPVTATAVAVCGRRTPDGCASAAEPGDRQALTASLKPQPPENSPLDACAS